jgi:RES domain-containing protein
VGIPNDLAIPSVHVQDLPAEWRRHPGSVELQDLGTRWANDRRTACLEVPSAVVAGEKNFLLNPLHRDFRRLEIGDPQPFEFDPRLLEG